MATKPFALPTPAPRTPQHRPVMKAPRNVPAFLVGRLPSLPKGMLPRYSAMLIAGGLVLSLGATTRMVETLSPARGTVPALQAELAPPAPAIRPRMTLDRIAPPPAAQYPYKGLITEMATKYGLSPELVAGVVYIESNFDKNSVSHAGAIGLMQLMPATARPLARKLGLGEPDLTDPRTNLELGCYFLRILLDKYDNHLPTVLSYYNGGRWGIVSRGVYRNRRYIRKVMDSYWRYAQPVSNGFSTARH